MLSLVLRRALGQYRLVAAVVALVTVAATLLGVCALLLGPTQDRAFARELQPSQPEDFDIDAFLVTLRNDDLVEVRETAADQLREVLGPLDPEVTVVETSPMRDLVSHGDSAVGYLSAGDGLAPRSRAALGPVAGDRHHRTDGDDGARGRGAPRSASRSATEVRLGGNSGFQGFYDPITLVVVGTFRPASDLGWESDPLTGDGVDPEYRRRARDRGGVRTVRGRRRGVPGQRVAGRAAAGDGPARHGARRPRVGDRRGRGVRGRRATGSRPTSPTA